MLITSLILPHPILSDCIYNYSLCKSESPYINIKSPWFAHHDTSLAFFLGDTPTQITKKNTGNSTESTNKACLFGLLTQYNGIMTFEGKYNTFTIEFKPNGFNKMFGIPANKICNNTFPANEVIGNGVENFYEQLLYASDVQEMAMLTDSFLIDFLNRRKAMYIHDGINRISNLLLTTLNTNISQYASQANMSMRNFERRFAEQVGTSPKLFCRLLRFNAAMKFKMSDPKKGMSEIAYECGYYDRMHMIKEFKQFANTSPANVFNDSSWFIEDSSTTIERIAL